MRSTVKPEQILYEYRHAPVPGGGFVTGFCFHPQEKGILYARTDIGGVYRYDFTAKSWVSLMDHVKATGKWESYPLSIALDPQNPDWLYIAGGDWKNNYLCRSKDRGEHFEYYALPAGVHGNASGRGTGERLMVDPKNSAIVYFGSQTEGLFISEDYGEHFHKLAVCPAGGKEETDIAFVWLDPGSEKDGRSQTIVVSTSGQGNSPGGTNRGNSLYLSKDGGRSFQALPGQPEAGEYGNYPGFVGQRAVFTKKYLFITMAAVKNSWAGWRGYACDMGGEQQGCILRYELTPQGEVISFAYVTPDTNRIYDEEDNSPVINEGCGFGGIAADDHHPGQLSCSTQGSKDKEERIFYTADYGEHWFSVLQGLTVGRMDFEGVPYMKPEYNNQDNLIHWLSDLKIDPFDANRAVFNTGTGIFMTENLLEGTEGKAVIWKACCKGLEETVHLNVYSPPRGEVQLIDIIGDLGGFAFADLTKPAENSFADENNHRYITCLNADYPEERPELVAVTARGNWIGKTTGGIIWSEDQCKTWRRLPDPVGISRKIDNLIARIRKPNTNAGWAALSSDAKTLIWSVGDGMYLPADAVVYTEDLGHTWVKCEVVDLMGEPVKGGLSDEARAVAGHSDKAPSAGYPTLKIFSDRVDPELFYGFGNDSRIYLSTDRGRVFREIAVPKEFPKLELGGIDTVMPAEIRAEADVCGTVWISAGEGGLWKLQFDKLNGRAGFVRISGKGEYIYRQGMGKAAPGSKYKTLYVNGLLYGEYGFYRSFDEGRTWQRINHEGQMYGDIRSITGDPRTFGRVYIATGSRGVLWGEPLEKM